MSVEIYITRPIPVGLLDRIDRLIREHYALAANRIPLGDVDVGVFRDKGYRDVGGNAFHDVR